VKIRHKLTLYFSLASAIIILGFGFAVYYFTSWYRKNEFFQRLTERIEIAEQFFLEKDAFSPADYEKIRVQFLNSLPQETEEVVKLPYSPDSLRYQYPTSFLDNIQTEDNVMYFSNDTIQGAGSVFHLKGGNYVVVITAVDHIGNRLLYNLRTIGALAMLICILVISALSHSISKILIFPIARKIRKANRISVENLHERLNVYNLDDELGELAIAFNHLLDRLEEAFKVQKLFVANASHEIRNPLTAILGETEVALEKVRTALEYKESLQNISIEAERLNGLVNNLLQLSTITYTNTEIKKENVHMIDFLKHVIDEFQVTLPKSILKLRIQEVNTNEAIVMANPNLLATALNNLIDNACKFSSYSPVDISLTFQPGKVLITITDNGIGISAEDIPKVKQPFFRAENVRSIKGTGIGIPLSNRVVELHNGQLEISSELNKGTIVTVILPLNS
jgi:signal transduction histidine kinase